MSSPIPTPINGKLTRWEEWRGVVYFIITVILSSIVFWHLDNLTSRRFAMRYPFAKLLFAIGLFLDFMSVVAYISTRVTGRYSSGFIGFGFICFLWAWLSCPVAIIFSTPQNLPLLWIHKLPDLLVLFTFSACFHVPFWFLDRNEEKHQ